MLILYLSAKRKNELEILLSIFDQSYLSSDIHILNVDDSVFPEKFQEIIRRLRMAITEPKMRDQMQIEDDFVSELSDYERLLYEKDKILEEERRQREEAEKQKEAVENEMQQRILFTIEKCLKRGMSMEETAELVSVSIKQVKEVAKKLDVG